MWQGVTNIILFILLGLVVSCGDVQPPSSQGSSLLEQDVKERYRAGDAIVMNFRIAGDPDLPLLIRNSSGHVLLYPEVRDEWVTYALPAELCKRAGEAKWTLLGNGNIISEGTVIIEAGMAVEAAEAYLGPKRLQAGSADSGMLVVLPTDGYDNLLQHSAPIFVNLLGGDFQERFKVPVTNQLGVLPLSAPQAAGRQVVGVEAGNANLPQMEMQVTHTDLEDFELFTQLTHNYADGHEEFRVYTSELKDRYGNLVTDGTQVEITMKEQGGNRIRQAYGLTVNGRAEVQFLHPAEPGSWNLTGSTLGSRTIKANSIAFFPAVQPFTLEFDADKGVLIGKGFTSYMGQQLPEGTGVEIHVVDADASVYRIGTQLSSNSFSVDFRSHLLPEGRYEVEVAIGGREETIAIEL